MKQPTELKRIYDAAVSASAEVQSLATKIQGLFDANSVTEALELRPQLDAAKSKESELHQLYLSMSAASQGQDDQARHFVPVNGDPEPQQVTDLRSRAEYQVAFLDALRLGLDPRSPRNGKHEILFNALTEAGGSPAGSEGGFLLPIDFDNMIHELKRSLVDLGRHFNIENVNTFSGWRAIETASAASPFAQIVLANGVQETENPTFAKVEYTLVDYGGYLPIHNGLLQDTPANIMAYLSRWLARKEVLTSNSLLLALVNALSPTEVSNYKTVYASIKTVLNTGLNPAVSASAKVFCNQTGLNLLDQLVDGTGRPLLQPDPVKEVELRIKGREVVVVADGEWANIETNTKTRIAIGDGKEFATLFRRQALEMATTTVGGDAWRKNQTELRGIMRANARPVDSAAMSVLSVTLPA